MFIVAILACTLVCFIETKSISENNTAILISKYSKVARWGVNENDTKPYIQEGRSSSGQSPWTRSGVNIIGSQSVKTEKPRAPYHYTVHRKLSKTDNRKVERIPAEGEVLQDRFNPRPYFGYGQIPPKSLETATYAPPKPTSAASSSGDNFDSFPAVFNVAPSTANPVDLYTSPYSSYNPPPVKADNSPISDTYPPVSQDSYAAPAPPDSDGIYDYKPMNTPVDQPKPSYVSLGPPLAYLPQKDNDHHHHEVDALPSDHDMSDDMSNDDMPDNQVPDDHMPDDHMPDDHMPDDHMPDDHMANNMPQDHHNDGPPNYPPKSEDDIYYPPDAGNGHDMMLDHSPKDYKPSDMTMDLAPPPSNGHMAHFPQYLYDGHHHDHYVYEEVPHTTTEATEDKRVSSGHYSYYYLGRKLWYIPLYFSVYFIIYVTILILKAIARHKIQYKQKWVSSQRSGRQIEVNQSENVDVLHRNVTEAIDKATRIYSTFAM